MKYSQVFNLVRMYTSREIHRNPHMTLYNELVPTYACMYVCMCVYRSVYGWVLNSTCLSVVRLRSHQGVTARARAHIRCYRPRSSSRARPHSGGTRRKDDPTLRNFTADVQLTLCELQTNRPFDQLKELSKKKIYRFSYLEYVRICENLQILRYLYVLSWILVEHIHYF